MATAAAALAARARRHIQHSFFAADAVRPDRSIPFRPANRFEERQFARLHAAGAIHEEQPGHYWIDLPAYDQLLHQRFERLRNLLLVFVLALAAIALIGGLSGSFN